MIIIVKIMTECLREFSFKNSLQQFYVVNAKSQHPTDCIATGSTQIWWHDWIDHNLHKDHWEKSLEHHTLEYVLLVDRQQHRKQTKLALTISTQTFALLAPHSDSH